MATMPQVGAPAASLGAGLPAGDLNTLRQGLGGVRGRGYKKGGAVDGDKKQKEPARQWGDTANDARDKIQPVALPKKLAKGGLTRKPKGLKVAIAIGKPSKKPISTPSPYDYEASEGTAPPPGPAPHGLKKGGTVKKNKGGKCDKMAAGGVAKVRKGFPNTIKAPKRLAKGGHVRGCGAATKGCTFSGVY